MLRRWNALAQVWRVDEAVRSNYDREPKDGFWLSSAIRNRRTINQYHGRFERNRFPCWVVMGWAAWLMAASSFQILISKFGSKPVCGASCRAAPRRRSLSQQQTHRHHHIIVSSRRGRAIKTIKTEEKQRKNCCRLLDKKDEAKEGKRTK